MAMPGRILLLEGDTTPATPTAGQILFYAKTSGLFYAMGSNGTEVPLGGGTGTVTSIGVSSNGTYAASLTVAASPVTTTGTITITPNVFSATVPGVVPLSGGGTTNFLRADGAWAAPAGGAGGTVTNTGGALTANSIVLGAGTNDTKVVAGFTTDGASKLNLGVSGTAGAIVFSGISTGTLTLTPLLAALGTNTLSLPATTDTLVGKNTTDTFTNKTFDTAGTGNVFRIAGTAISAVTGTGSNVLSASPTFTGAPLSTTAAVDTNTTQIATTAFVLGQKGTATPLVNGTAAAGTSTRYAPIDHVHPQDNLKAGTTQTVGFSASTPGAVTDGLIGNFRMPWAGTLNTVYVITGVGTTTITVKRNGTTLGSAISGGTTETSGTFTQAFAAGDYISFTASSSSGCSNLTTTPIFTRVFAQ